MKNSSMGARSRKSTRAKHLAAWERRPPGTPRSQEGIYSRAKPDPCERLARTEQAAVSWLALLKGILVDPCADTTCDRSDEMGALAIAERRSGVPGAILTAYWAGSSAARLAIAKLVLSELRTQRGWLDKPRDRIKVKGVILDAVDEFRGVYIGDRKRRARLRGMDNHAYESLFKLAAGLLHAWLGYIQPEWKRALFQHATGDSKAIIPLGREKTLSDWFRARVTPKASEIRPLPDGRMPETLYPCQTPDSLWHPERN